MARFITQDEQIIDGVKSYRAAASMYVLSKEQMEDDKASIVAYMNDEGVEVMQAGNALVKITRYMSSRFDSIKFRRDYPELAKEYTTETEAIRFTVKDA